MKTIRKPKFTFNVPTPGEMEVKMKDYETKTGKPLPDDFFEQVMDKEKVEQYNEYLKREQKEKEKLQRLKDICYAQNKK